MGPSSPLNNSIRLLNALGDPIRLRILHLLSQSGEICVCHLHLALDLPQPTISRHLARLRRDGLVGIRREGHWIHYRLTVDKDPQAANIFQSFYSFLTEDSTIKEDSDRLAKVRSSECIIPTDKIFA